jgi:hypothetical protein
MTDTPPAARPAPPRLPDARGWALIGLFALIFFVLALIAWQPSLADNKLFFSLASNITTGGFLFALGFYFGSAKKDPPSAGAAQ